MEKPESQQFAVGKRLTRDLYTPSGTLLVSAASIITREHMKLIEKHGIVLSQEDVASVGPYSGEESFLYAQLIHDTVMEVSHLFEEVRATKEVPIADLRSKIIPMIQEVSAPDTPLTELFASLQAKDDYTYRHNIAVGVFAGLIGYWIRLDRQEQLQLMTAALLHDIGKMLIPEDILNKPGKLTNAEYDVMKHHTILGYELLKKTIGVTHRQALVALQHHERMDGSGYPFGLTGRHVDLFGRITSVADQFHAMTSKRVYRYPAPFYQVLSQMEKDTFGALDPAITRVFLEKVMSSLIGHSVMLTDGRQGVILMMNAQELTRPLIQTGERFIDLSKEPAVHIEQIL